MAAAVPNYLLIRLFLSRAEAETSVFNPFERQTDRRPLVAVVVMTAQKWKYGFIESKLFQSKLGNRLKTITTSVLSLLPPAGALFHKHSLSYELLTSDR